MISLYCCDVAKSVLVCAPSLTVSLWSVSQYWVTLKSETICAHIALCDDGGATESKCCKIAMKTIANTAKIAAMIVCNENYEQKLARQRRQQRRRHGQRRWWRWRWRKKLNTHPCTHFKHTQYLEKKRKLKIEIKDHSNTNIEYISIYWIDGRSWAKPERYRVCVIWSVANDRPYERWNWRCISNKKEKEKESRNDKPTAQWIERTQQTKIRIVPTKIKWNSQYIKIWALPRRCEKKRILNIPFGFDYTHSHT